MVIHLVGRQQTEQLAEQRRVILLPHCQPEFGPHQFGVVQHQLLFVLGQRHSQRITVDMPRQRLRQLLQIPVADRRLLIQRVTTRRIRVVADKIGHIGIDKAVGAVIQRQAEQRHVVGVHHPVTEARRLPFGNQPRGATHYLGKQLGAILQLGEVVAQQIIDKLRDLLPLPAPGEILDMTEAQVAGGGAQHGRPGLDLFAVNGLLAAHQHQRPGGRYAEGMERLGGQIFANARAQYGAAIAKTGEGGLARPFQMEIPAQAIGRQLLTQQQRPAIAKPWAIAAELMAGIHLRHRLHAGQ